jgi:membrane-associated phospholipid phosphatase
MLISAIILNIVIQNSIVLGLRDTVILICCLIPGIIHFATGGNKTKKRFITLLLMLSGLVTLLAAYYLIDTPPTTLKGLVISIIVGSGAIIIDRFWDMSFHASISMSCAALFIPFSTAIMLIVGSLSIIVGLARLPIKQHTPIQVIAGWVYGYGLTSVLVFLLLPHQQ